MFNLEWREIAILACVGSFWLIVLNRLLVGLRGKDGKEKDSKEKVSD